MGNGIKQYHCADIITNGSEVEREHPEEIKKLSKPVYIPA